MTKRTAILLVLALGVSTGEARADGADAAALRDQCTKAMNADPGFAKSIVIVAENQYRKAKLEQIDKENCTIAVHQAEEKQIAKNERHVILAYAAMWLLAAGFLMFLWRRQQRLVSEIGQLHRELAEATAAPAPAPAKAVAKVVEKPKPKADDKKADDKKVDDKKADDKKAEKKADDKKVDDKKADENKAEKKADDKKADKNDDDDEASNKDPVTKDDD